MRVLIQHEATRVPWHVSRSALQGFLTDVQVIHFASLRPNGPPLEASAARIDGATLGRSVLGTTPELP